MKRNVYVLVALLVSSNLVFARRIDNPASLNRMAVVKSGATFKLYYKSSEITDVKVSILDANDKVVFTESLKKVEGFVRPYNFSNLPEGDYSIEISDRNGRSTEKVSYQTNTVPDADGKFARLLKVAGSERYLLTLSNKEADAITVKIFDDSNNIIYNQKEEIKSDFGKIYNLKRFSGKFTFEITDKNGAVTSLSN